MIVLSYKMMLSYQKPPDYTCILNVYSVKFFLNVSQSSNVSIYNNFVYMNLRKPVFATLYVVTRCTFSQPCLVKICYDKAGNLPNKGENFNTQTWGKNCIFSYLYDW